MKGSSDNNLKIRLKQLIIEACELDIKTDDINDDDPFFGSESELGLDSIDGLQIAVAIQNNLGIVITDSKEMRRILKSVNTFADFIQPE